MVDHFIAAHNSMHDREVTGLSPEAFSLVMNHPFPGNIRELHDILEHAFVLCPSGTIEPRHLPPYLSQRPAEEVVSGASGLNLKEVEQTLIEEALRKHEGNRKLAAEDLCVNPSTLYRKIKQYHIEFSNRDGRGRRAEKFSE